MVPQIDFLPASYVQQRQRRRKAVHRRAVVAAFLALIALGAVRQWQIQKGMERTRDRLRTHAREMLSQLGSTEAHKRRIAELDARADLVTQLRLHASATAVLCAVAETLPDSATLVEFHFGDETAPGATTRAPGAATAGPRSAVTTELARLRERDAQAAPTVVLTGLATDDISVSRYMAALEATGLFEEIRLLVSEEATIREISMRRFSVRLRLRRPSIDAAVDAGPGGAAVAARVPVRGANP